MHDASGDYISAHTIEANVGIYTQPGTQPSYLAIGEFGVGTADPNATAVSGVAQETQDRIFLESETTDVKTPVDIYLMDVDPRDRRRHNRWVTPFEMTGENQTGNPTRRHHDPVHRRPAAARPPAGDEGADRPAQPADAHDPGRRRARSARRSSSSTSRSLDACLARTRRRWPTGSSPASTTRRRSSSSSRRT